MRTGKVIQTLGIHVAFVLLFIGCTKSEPEPIVGSAINFAPQATRAVVTSLGNGDSFAVWARESSNGTSNMILTQEEVHCADNVWSYNHLRYWKMGATYDFYALYPHNLSGVSLTDADNNQPPHLVVSRFDARNATDLMAAEQTNLTYSGNPSPVLFTFRHLLSKVEIVGRIDPALATAGVSGQIVDAKLYGMAATGDCTIDIGTYGRWELSPISTAATPFQAAANIPLFMDGSSLFGEMLSIPQAVNDNFILEVTYEYTDPYQATTRNTKTIRLSTAGVSAWEPSMSYRYTFTLGNDYILFAKPEVSPWRTASGGIITIE